MIKLHRHFGVEYDYQEVTDPAQLKHAIDYYGLVCINNASIASEPENLLEFVKKIGTVLDFSESLSHKKAWRFPRTLPGLEINTSYGSNEDLSSHQDGFWYSTNKTITCMSLDLTNFPDGEKPSDTIFYNSSQELKNISPEFLRFLKSLAVTHYVPNSDSELNQLTKTQHQRFINKLYDRYQHDPEKLKKFISRYKSLKKDPINPGDFLIDQLIGVDDMGEWIHWSPSGQPLIVNLKPSESLIVSNYINQTIFQPHNMYCHAWKKNQIVFWNNKRLIHSRLTNGTVQSERLMYRIQFM
jgi:alpha-ketoglutarate-dependent taurine dioxygenase